MTKRQIKQSQVRASITAKHKAMTDARIAKHGIITQAMIDAWNARKQD